jgi:hypothetical protein
MFFNESLIKLYRVDGRMINAYEAVCGIRIERGNGNAQRKPARVTLFPQHNPHKPTWDRTGVALGRSLSYSTTPALLSKQLNKNISYSVF